MTHNRDSLAAWAKFIAAAAIVSIGGLFVLGGIYAAGVRFGNAQLILIITIGLVGLNLIGRRLGVAK